MEREREVFLIRGKEERRKEGKGKGERRKEKLVHW